MRDVAPRGILLLTPLNSNLEKRRGKYPPLGTPHWQTSNKMARQIKAIHFSSRAQVMRLGCRSAGLQITSEC
jgi:hypothetical protein